MLSLKLVANTAARGAGALSSSQINNKLTPTNIGALESANVVLDKKGLYQRSFTTASIRDGFLSQAVRISHGYPLSSLAQNIVLPERPKKPPTPWITFIKERKGEVLRQKDKMTAAELSVILAKEWKGIDKTKYQQEFEQKQKEYQRKLQEHESSLTKEQLQYLNLQKELKREKRANKLLKKTKPPVLPRNPANLYCHERSKQVDIKEQLKYRKATEVFSDIFKEYRSLSDHEKKKYIDMQGQDKFRFQHEFLAWYESIQNDETLTKAALEKADALRDRYKSLNYI